MQNTRIDFPDIFDNKREVMVVFQSELVNTLFFSPYILVFFFELILVSEALQMREVFEELAVDRRQISLEERF